MDPFNLFKDFLNDPFFHGIRSQEFMNNDNRWESLKEKGNSLFREKKYEEALQYYDKAIDINDNIEVLHSNKGTCLKCLQNYNGAKIEYIKALKINPNNSKNLNRLASVLLILGDLNEANNIQKKALNIEPNNIAFKQQMETINQMIFEEEEIKKLLKENELNEIGKKYQSLNDKFPELMYLKKRYILFLFDNVKYKEAILFLNDQLKNNAINKNDKEFIYIMCLSLYYVGEYKTVEEMVNNILKNSSENIYKELLYKIKNLEPAKKKGNDLYEQQKYEDAIKAYTLALKIDPQHKKYNSIIYANRASCFQKLEKYYDALNDCNQSLKINPNYSKGYVKRANIYLKLKNFKAALDDFEKAKKLDPKSPGFESYLHDINRKNHFLENELKLEKSKNQQLSQEIISLKNKIREQNNKIDDKNDIIYDLKNKIKELQDIKYNNREDKKVMGLMEKLVEKEESLKKMKLRYPFEIAEGEKIMSVNIVSPEYSITHSIICKNTHLFNYLENKLYEKYPELLESENFFIVNGDKVNKYKTLEENKIKDNDIITLESFGKDDEDDNISLSKNPFVSKNSRGSFSSISSLGDSISSRVSLEEILKNNNQNTNSKNDKEKIYYNSNNDIDE